MIIVPEREIAALVMPSDCFRVVEKVFASMSRRTAFNYPVVRETIGYADAIYGVKSGFDLESFALGLKAGGFWPQNVNKHLTNHQSTIVLFEAATGRCRAVVGGNLLTSLRTAAASAISIKYLARKDSKVLGMIGAGHQSKYQLRAALDQHPFERVIAWNFHQEMLDRLRETASERDVPFEAVDLNRLGAEADVIIMITSSHSAILKSSQVRAGTHLACMGADTKGKQEVEAKLLTATTIFADEVSQAITIGEAQHAIAQGLIRSSEIVQIGSVINGDHPGRTSDEEITLFDGTGVSLQDLAVASVAVDLAVSKGVAIKIDV